MRIFISLILFVSACMASEEVRPYSIVEIINNEYEISLINNQDLNKDINVHRLSNDKGVIAINGGYYSKDYRSLGYLKIENKIINSQINPGLSGMLCIDASGILKLNWSKGTEVNAFPDIFQNGPFLIDPGGKLGIHSDDGKIANRTCVGLKSNGNIILIYARGITLYNLALAVARHDTETISLLNMDGGPMAGLWSSDNKEIQFNNSVPAISYIKFSRK